MTRLVHLLSVVCTFLNVLASSSQWTMESHPWRRYCTETTSAALRPDLRWGLWVVNKIYVASCFRSHFLPTTHSTGDWWRNKFQTLRIPRISFHSNHRHHHHYFVQRDNNNEYQPKRGCFFLRPWFLQPVLCPKFHISRISRISATGQCTHTKHVFTHRPKM